MTFNSFTIMLTIGVFVCVLGLVSAGPSVTKSRQDIQDYKEFLEKSRRDDGFRLSERMLQNPKANEWENSGKFEGDIILDDWQIEALVEQFANPETRKAYIWPNTKWPGNTVVYEFGAGEFNAAQQEAILDAMRYISFYTCLQFRVRQPWDSNYVRLTGHPDGCYANVGYWGSRGVHILNLARANPGQGCFILTTIIHEWLHIAGMFHMQSTYNRYDYVRVLWENVWPGMEHNFDRYDTNIVSNLGVPYEYDSCMHYGAYGFTTNGQPTLLPIRHTTVEMGQQVYVTYHDWLRTSRHYNCPGAWSNTAEEAAAYKFELPENSVKTENFNEEKKK